MADTPNHEYNVPDQGDQDWHQPLNENFEDFEVDIELRDQEANLGNYQPTQGAKFLATDTGVVYTGDGSNWIAQFVLPGYDDSAGEAEFGQTVSVPGLTGSLTGGQELTTIAGTNLSIDSNGQLNASGGGGGGGGGIQSLSGGDGIDPSSIGDGDTLSVAWGDANDLDSDGNVTGGGGGGGIQNLSGGDGIDPASIGDGDTLSVAWGDASDLDGSGSLTRTVIGSLSGGDGIAPGSIGDGDTLSVAWGDANDLDSDGNVTSQNWTASNNLLAPSDSSIDGIDVGQVETTTLTVDGTPTLQLSSTGTDSNDNTAGGNVIGGYKGNGVQNDAVGATVGGGGASGTSPVNGSTRDNINEVFGDYGTIAGGWNNRAGALSTVGGGRSNTAGDSFSTIAGGTGNTISAPEGTIGGGQNNTVSTGSGTVGGGRDNEAGGIHSTVGGGDENTASGESATVPGGFLNTASGDFSFAAGSGAEAGNDGAFVWSDMTNSFSSTGPNQFLINASGGTGIGTNDPVTTFHVKDSVAGSGGDNLGRHVAAIENTSSSSSPIPDVLGLELTNVTDPGEFHSYISFMDDSGTIGNIQGDGNGGVEFVGSLADFAEYFPKADPDAEFADGTVVGLRDGEVVDLAAESDPDTVLVVSTAPLVTGNRPIDEDERDGYVKLSLVGQVPVRVSESVSHGDVLVASPDGDGTAVARADCAEAGCPVVGMALEACEAGEQVLALIGGPGMDAASTAAGQPSVDSDTQRETQAARLEALEAENKGLRTGLAEKDDRIEDLEAENEALRERLAAVEERLAGLDGGSGAPPVSADD